MKAKGKSRRKRKKMLEDKIKKLIGKAIEGMNNAYAPRSNFPVGAAVLTSKGNMYQGCNIESVISGLGTCAERSAIDHAVAHGEYNFEAIAIVTKAKTPVKPCGACLQYISEFSQVAQKDVEIIMATSNGKYKKSRINKMLPGMFGPRDAKLDLRKYQK